ncbi:hypothetical protein JOJ88_003244 [Pantoea cypripedii]|nr:hypothetical protein [Pantoea cypripedii]
MDNSFIIIDFFRECCVDQHSFNLIARLPLNMAITQSTDHAFPRLQLIRITLRKIIRTKDWDEYQMVDADALKAGKPRDAG